MAFEQKKTYRMEDLLEIMALLRSENGCPWDKEQTHETIRKNFIEETYEACEAIDQKDSAHLCEELGDVLEQIVFHSQLEKEAGRFDFNDVTDGICKKLVFRHPHVFGSVKVADSDEVLKNWDQIKKDARQQTYTQTLETVPGSLPALMRAEKVQKRAGRAGMEYPDTESAFADLRSEVEELKDAIDTGDSTAADELGDVLFAAVNVARHLGADPEEALTRATDRFTRRFSVTEQLADEQGIDMAHTPLDELNVLWAEAKRRLRQDEVK